MMHAAPSMLYHASPRSVVRVCAGGRRSAPSESVRPRVPLPPPPPLYPVPVCRESNAFVDGRCGTRERARVACMSMCECVDFCHLTLESLYD